MVGDRRIHQNYIPSNLIPFSEGEMIGVPNSEGWMICTDKLPLWQSIAKKSTFIPKAVDDLFGEDAEDGFQRAHSPYPRKNRLKISDPTPLKEMKSASTNPAKNGSLPNTQN